MLVASDQENLVHTHQTTAAGKPLNHGLRGLQPKTPGNRAPKTPFRATINDENKQLAFDAQKTISQALGKGNENALQSGKKGGKYDKTAFVTPLGPRVRAPLGMKTTNAKAHAFQTPAPAQQNIKTLKTSKKSAPIPTSIKSKIIIAPPEPVQVDLLSREVNDEVPEVEYAPPTPIDLPDPPMDLDYDDAFAQLRGKNLCRGYSEVYGEPRDEHGVLLRVRKQQEVAVQYDKEQEERFKKEWADFEPLNLDEELDKQVDRMIAAGPKNNPLEKSNVDTVRARGAANALSESRLPTTALKPTATLLHKKKASTFSVLGSKKTPGPSNPSSMRNAAAAAVSKNTVGFSRGRNVASILPKNHGQTTRGKPKTIKSVPKDQVKIHPAEFRELYGDPPEGSEMWFRFHDCGLFDHGPENEHEPDDYLTGELSTTDFFPEDEGEGLFQLSLP